MLFCAWIIKKEHKENKLLKYSIGFLLIISFIVGIHSVYSDIRYNFSGSKQISEYIKNNLQNEKTFIVSNFAIFSICYTFLHISL